jgi:hypothetical protein
MVLGGLAALVSLGLAIGFVFRQAGYFALTSSRGPTEALTGVLLLIACGAYYGAAKFYCAQWLAMSPRSIARAVVERAVLPGAVIMLLVRMPFGALGSVEMTLLLLLAVSLTDLGGGMRRAMAHRFAELDAMNRRMLFSRYPPRHRADLLPMDVLFFLLTAGLLFRRFT